MREDCVHYETRTYDDGEVARFCTKDLAPEAPWRCPEGCPGYERILMISGDFEQGSLASTPAVEPEPDDAPDDIAAVLDEAESIVNEAAPEVVAEVERQQAKRHWWSRKPRGDGDDGSGFRLSDR